MDRLEKGAWIINTVKHTSGVRTDTIELNEIGITERAGKAGVLLGKLLVDKEEIISEKKLNAFARTSNISMDAIKTYAELLKKFGQVDYSEDRFGNISEMEVYCFSTESAINTVAEIFDYYEPNDIEKGNLECLKMTFELPLLKEDLYNALEEKGFDSEKTINDIFAIEDTFCLIKKETIDNKDIYFNEYAFSDDAVKISKALSILPERRRLDVEYVMEQVNNSQGFLADNFIGKVDSKIISMMEGVGLLNGITVNSENGEATFYTTPQIVGPKVGKCRISTDVFNHAKLLLCSLRYGEYKSGVSRGAINSTDKMFNIINKLIRGEWVGPCTAIGQDYRLLELSGVISVLPSGDMFKMKLRQKEVGELVKQMLKHNMVVNDSVSDFDIFNNLPSSYKTPEDRRKEIQANITTPVKQIQESFINSIRTGGVF